MLVVVLCAMHDLAWDDKNSQTDCSSLVVVVEIFFTATTVCELRRGTETGIWDVMDDNNNNDDCFHLP